MNDQHSKWRFKGWETIGKYIPFVPALAPSLSLWLLKGEEPWTWTEIFVALLSGAFSAFTAWVVVSYAQEGTITRIEETQTMIEERYKQAVAEIEGRYEQMIQLSGDQLQRLNPWYYSHESLNYFERDLPPAAPQEIWVVSRRLDYESEGGLFAESIRKNLKAGWEYEYIIPDHREIRAIAKQRKREWDKSERTGKVTVWLLPDGDFDYLSDIIVYNPPSINNASSVFRTDVFIELLTTKNISQRGWLRLPDDRVQEITDHIMAHRSRAKELT